MTSPVCPACRAQIPLDAYTCTRCGLAVRPTCAECGEPLTFGMRFCSRCGSTLEAAPVLPYYESPAPARRAPEPRAAPKPQWSPVAVRTAPEHDLGSETMPIAPPVAAAWDEPRRRGSRLFRFLGVGVAAGVLVAGALLALELTTPGTGTPPSRVALETFTFSNFGISVDVPKQWTVDRTTVDGRSAVEFAEPPPDPTRVSQRRLVVMSEKLTLASARKDATKIGTKEHVSYERVGITDGLLVSDRDAFRHRYTTSSGRFDQWWVAKGDGSYRAEFFTTASHADEAAVLFDRIIRTFRVL